VRRNESTEGEGGEVIVSQVNRRGRGKKAVEELTFKDKAKRRE